jgi:hypothetical protein
MEKWRFQCILSDALRFISQMTQQTIYRNALNNPMRDLLMIIVSPTQHGPANEFDKSPS